MAVENAKEEPEQLWVAEVSASTTSMTDVERGRLSRGDITSNSARERSYIRKLDSIILPTIALLYFFEYIDRGNIANAKLLGIDQGRETEFEGVGPGIETLSPSQWQTVVMIFYVGLSLLQVPGSIAYRVFSPSKWIAFSVCGWCVVCVLQTTAFNFSGLVACRVFLGAFEGCFGTGIVYYLSIWYRRDELSVRLFWYLGSTAFAGAFGGLIAFGIDHISSSVPNWKLLFIIEGIPGFLLGLFCIYWLPDRPTKNSRFKDEFARISIERYEREFVDSPGMGIKRQHFSMALRDWKLYTQAAIYFATASLLASISGFLPSIIQGLGYKSIATANLMTVPPYAIAFALMFITSYSSDRFKERGYHISGLAIIAAAMYVCLARLPENQLGAKYACVCIAVACVYSTYPPGHAWAANNLGNESKRAVGMGVYTALGNLGSIVGSYFYPSTDGPLYEKGHYICFGMALVTASLALANSLVLQGINRARDKRHGKPDDEVPDVSVLADKHHKFRYIT